MPRSSPRYALQALAATESRPAALLVQRRHMGQEIEQVLPLSAFDAGDLRAVREAAVALQP